MITTVALDEHAKRTLEYLDEAAKLTTLADAYRIKVGLELIAARRRVEAGETNLSWPAWCARYIKRSERDIRRLMASANADDPAQAREEEKARNRAAKPAGSRASSPWQVHDEGAGAFLRGVPQDDCPYTDRRRHAAWRKGWSETEQRSGASPVSDETRNGLSELRETLGRHWRQLSRADQEALVNWLIERMTDPPIVQGSSSLNGLPRSDTTSNVGRFADQH
jgi:ribosome modulation factor